MKRISFTNNLYKYIFIIVTSLLITACGGSGGSSNNSDNNNGRGDSTNTGDTEFIEVSSGDVYQLPAVENYKSPTETPQYQGPNGQAELNRLNAITFLEAFYEATEPAVLTASAILDFEPYSLFNYEFSGTGTGSDLSEETECSTGSADIDSYIYEPVNEQAQFMVVFTYHGCRLGGIVIDGQIIVKVKASAGGINYMEGWIENYKITTGSDYIVSHGHFTSTRSQTSIDRLVVDFSATNSIYLAEDMTLSDHLMAGRLYHNHYGYLELGLDPALDLKLIGTEGAVLSASLDKEPEDDVLQLNLITAEGLVLNNVLPVYAVFNYPLHENLLPTPVFNDEPEVIRETFLTLSAEESFDGNYDFLTYRWEILSSPEGCESVLTTDSGLITEFSSPCRGIHKVRLNIFDGYAGASTDITINVVPAAPRVAKVDFYLDEEQGFNFTIPMIDADLDGPYVFQKIFGVEGISVDQNGVVTGDPISFSKNGSYTFGVEISNHFTSTFDITVNVESGNIYNKAYNADVPGDLGNGNWSDIDADNFPDRLVEYYNTFAIVEFANGKTDYDHIELRELSPTGIITRKALDVLENEGEEILLAYHDRVLILDGINYTVLKTIEFPRNLTVVERDIQYYFIDGINPGIFISREYSNNGMSGDTYFYDLINDTERLLIADDLSSFPGEAWQADINGDGSNELIFRTGVFYLDGSFVELSQNIHAVADITGDGVPELISESWSSLGGPEEVTLTILNPVSGLPDSTQTISLNMDGGSSLSNIKVRFNNIDADPEAELLLIWSSSGQSIDLYENSESGFSYDQTLSIAADNIWYPFDSLAQLTPDTAAMFLSFGFGAITTLTKDAGFQQFETEFGKYVTHLHDAGGLFKLEENDNGEVGYLCNSYKSAYSQSGGSTPMCKLILDAQAELMNYQVYNNIFPPYSTEDMALVHHSDTTASLAKFGFAGQINVYDLENDLERSSFVLDDFTHFLSGDLNQDNNDELYGIGESGLQLINLDSYSSDIILANETGRRIVDLLLITDFANNRPPVLLSLVIESFESPNQYSLYLYVYEMTEAGLERVDRRLLQSPSGRYNSFNGAHHFNLAVQDTNNDNIPELLVTSSGSSGDTSLPGVTDIWIFNKDLNLVNSLFAELDMYLIPDLEQYAKANIIGVFDDSQYPGAGYLDRNIHSRFVEVDIAEQKVIWKSPVFPGEMVRKTFICRGNELAGCNKSAVFESGVLFFQ